MTSKEQARRHISNAFYRARNEGHTMEDACDAAVSHLDRDGLLVGDCICNYGPGTEGPEETCPQHGRTLEDWINRADVVQSRLNRVSRVLGCMQANDAGGITAELIHDLRAALRDEDTVAEVEMDKAREEVMEQRHREYWE